MLGLPLLIGKLSRCSGEELAIELRRCFALMKMVVRSGPQEIGRGRLLQIFCPHRKSLQHRGVLLGFRGRQGQAGPRIRVVGLPVEPPSPAPLRLADRAFPATGCGLAPPAAPDRPGGLRPGGHRWDPPRPDGLPRYKRRPASGPSGSGRHPLKASLGWRRRSFSNTGSRLFVLSLTNQRGRQLRVQGGIVRIAPQGGLQQRLGVPVLPLLEQEVNQSGGCRRTPYCFPAGSGGRASTRFRRLSPRSPCRRWLPAI